MKHLLILAVLTSICGADEKVYLFDYSDENDTIYKYYSFKDDLKNIKNISKDNLEEMITPKEALLAVERSAKYKKLDLKRSNLDSITLSFLGIVKVANRPQIVYEVLYLDDKGFYKHLYVLSNGVVLQKELKVKRKTTVPKSGR